MRCLYVEKLQDSGCNNGQYPRYVESFDREMPPMFGNFCACGRGCSNTDVFPRYVDVPIIYVDSDKMDALYQKYVYNVLGIHSPVSYIP